MYVVNLLAVLYIICATEDFSIPKISRVFLRGTYWDISHSNVSRKPAPSSHGQEDQKMRHQCLADVRTSSILNALSNWYCNSTAIRDLQESALRR